MSCEISPNPSRPMDPAMLPTAASVLSRSEMLTCWRWKLHQPQRGHLWCPWMDRLCLLGLKLRADLFREEYMLLDGVFVGALSLAAQRWIQVHVVFIACFCSGHSLLNLAVIVVNDMLIELQKKLQMEIQISRLQRSLPHACAPMIACWCRAS